MSKCPIAIKKQKDPFTNIFHCYFETQSLSEISEFIRLAAKSGWTANKNADQNLDSSGNTEQNLHVYQKSAKTSQAKFVSDYVILIHVYLLSGRALKS